MIPLTLQQVAAVTGGRVIGDPATTVDEIATDSRTVPHGQPLFVALRGDHGDGHDHAAAAVAAGATAVLAEREVDAAGAPLVQVADTWTALAALGAEVRRLVAPTTVAITGSVGKTTVKDLTAAAVGTQRRVRAARGSFNNELGVPLTLLGLQHDTEILVAEIGARHPGDIAQLAPLVAPDLAVVSAVAGVHLEVFRTVDAVARAKRELVEALGPDGIAVLNVGDPRVAAMADHAPAVLRVGVDVADADVRTESVRLDRHARATAQVVTPWGQTAVTLPVAGRHQVVNALLALAVAAQLGVDLDAAAAGIAAATVSPWRGEVVDAGGVVVVNDAYNASPIAMAAALDTLQAIERTGRTWAVLGVMAEIGPTSADEHLAVGRRCAELGVDRIVTVGAEAAVIGDGAVAAGLPADRVERVADAAAASACLLPGLAAGDVVLVKASRVAGMEGLAGELVAARSDAVAGARRGDLPAREHRP